MKFVKYTERNNHEGEVWNFYIRVKDNEKDLRAFKNMINTYEDENYFDRGSGDYKLDLRKHYNKRYVDRKADCSGEEGRYGESNTVLDKRFDFIRLFNILVYKKAIEDAEINLRWYPNEWAKWYEPRETTSNIFAMLTFYGKNDILMIYFLGKTQILVEETGNETELDRFHNFRPESFKIERKVYGEFMPASIKRIYGRFRFDKAVEHFEKTKATDYLIRSIYKFEIHKYFV